MHLTMGLPTFVPHGREEQLAWYRRIDEGPWDGLATSEHLLHPWSWAVVPELAAAAAMTERVRLWTDVVALPTRNAVTFAKDVATIDVLSGGRVTLGVGIGGWDEDYLAVGADVRGKRLQMDEFVRTMRDLWTQEPPIEGHHPVGPAPLQAGAVPLVAGVAGPKALARVATWAAGVTDGSHTLRLDAEALVVQRGRVVDAWRAAGRAEAPHFSAPIWFALGPDPKRQMAEYVQNFLGSRLGGASPESLLDAPSAGTSNVGASGLRDAVDGARAAGLDELRLFPTTADPSEIDRAREVLGV